MRLRTAWVNERSHPDILPYAAEEVVLLVNYVTNSMSKDYSEIEKRYAGRTAVDDDANPISSLHHPLQRMYVIETDRFRYLLSDYHRIRAIKITKFPLNILNRHLNPPAPSTDPTDPYPNPLPPLLSDAEANFAAELVLADKAYLSAPLSSAPAPLADPYYVTNADGTATAVEPRPNLSVGRIYRVEAPSVDVNRGGGAVHSLLEGAIAAGAVEDVDKLVRHGAIQLL